MKLKADVTFKWGDFARVEEVIVPKLMKGADAAATIVLERSQEKVPVDTGELKSSGHKTVEWEGKKVTGYVEYRAGHAAYVEFGTGQRGASSPGAGPVSYDENWPGMRAQPYLRPSIDENPGEIIDAFQTEINK